MKKIRVFHAHECVCAVCVPKPIATFAAKVTRESFNALGTIYEHYKLPEGNKMPTMDILHGHSVPLQRTGDEVV